LRFYWRDEETPACVFTEGHRLHTRGIRQSAIAVSDVIALAIFTPVGEDWLSEAGEIA
jgi:hypothetical protein